MTLNRRCQQGFSLIELSIALAIIGVVVAGGLSMSTSMVDRQAYVQTGNQMDEVEKALAAFVAVNNRLPCPADPAPSITDNGFGAEVANCSTLDPASPPGDLIAANGTAGNRVWIGALPVRTLGLRDRFAADEYGNRYTYAVTAAHTTFAGYTNTPALPTANNGAIILQDGSTPPVTIVDDAAYTIVSHGGDGKGAYRYETASNTVNCTGGRDAENCNHTNAIFRDTRFNRGSVANNWFDDTVRFARREMINLTADNASATKQQPWIVSGANMYNSNTGNVGVGVATPTAKLDVLSTGNNSAARIATTRTLVGAAQSTGTALTLESNGGPGLQIETYNSAHGLFLNSRLNQSGMTIVSNGNNADSLRIDHAGENGQGIDVTMNAGTNSEGIHIAQASKGIVIEADGSQLGLEINDTSGDFVHLGRQGEGTKNHIRSKSGFTARALSIDTAWRGVEVKIENPSHSDPMGFYVIEANSDAIGGGSLFSGSSESEYFTGLDLAMRGANSTAITAMNNNGGSRGCSIGTATNAMECTGTVTINGAVVTPSDVRLKKDIVALDKSQGLDAVRKLRPVTYGWNDGRSKETEIGFIAQEVQKLIPSVVSRLSQKAKDGSHYLGVQYDRLIAPLVLAVQQLADRLDGQDAKIKALEAENAALKARLDALEAKLAK